jgi:restriction endonuclease S subunit
MLKLLMSELCTMRKGQTINEVDIYNFKGVNQNNAVPVVSSMTLNNGVMGYIDRKHMSSYKKIGRKGDLSWVTNGYAGKVTLRDSDFLPTEKCGVAAIKKKYKEVVNPKWLEIYLNSITKKYVVAKEGNGKLEIVQMKNIPVIIPDLNEQKLIVEEYEKNQLIIKHLKEKIKIIDKELSTKVSYRSKKFKISELFQITSGMRITKEEVYANQGNIPIITSQSKRSGIAWHGDKNWLKTFIKKDKKVLINQECITWTKEGNAGKMFYRNYEFFPIDVAGVLIKKEENINLKWFIFEAQNIFYKNVVSKGGQGKLYEEQMANIEVEIPVKENGEIDTDLQNEIYAEYKRLSDIKERLESLIERYIL